MKELFRKALAFRDRSVAAQRDRYWRLRITFAFLLAALAKFGADFYEWLSKR